MNFLKDIITYVRRIVKSPSDSVLSDALIIDFINRFWIMDVDARMQHFDLKTKYSFQTTPGVDRYNMPLYSLQTETPGFPGQPPQTIGMYPVYQGFLQSVKINGVPVSFQTQKNEFENWFPNVLQNLQQVGTGDGLASHSYNLKIPILPSFPIPPNPPLQGLIRGHIDMAGIISTGNNIDPPLADNVTAPTAIPEMPVTSVDSAVYITSIDATGAPVVIADSGFFLAGAVNYGLLMKPGPAPFGNQPLGVYDISNNTVNYFTGEINVDFGVTIPQGNAINVQCFYFQSGLPRGILFYNNVLTLRSPPDRAYLVELDAYLTPAAFFDTDAAIPFAYMAEYIARGAARKILSDTYDVEQFNFYEGLFREQENLVWKRSQRQWTSTRVETIYSQGINQGQSGYNNAGGSML